jgi:hypothetical protein
MAHHVETMLSQIVPLRNKTTINDNVSASATMVNTICVIHMIILMVGCCLVTKTAIAMVAMLLLLSGVLLTPMLMGVVVLVVYRIPHKS